MRKDRKKQIRVLISAGGTGGHLIPAQQLAYSLKEKGCRHIVFAAKDISKRSTFQKNRFIYKDIASSLPTKKNLFRFFFSIIKGLFQSIGLILRLKPDVVVGFGSYHTFPVILAAAILRKKIVLFEANTKLGKVNRFFSKIAVITSQFPLTNKMKTKEVIIKHLPWHKVSKKRDDKLYETLGLKKGVFTFFIYGGSQGSKYINQVFCDAVRLIQKRKNIQVVHLIGKDQKEEDVKRYYKELKIDAYVKGFEKKIHQILPLADLIIARSGASTIAEILTFEIPAILIPFPNASEAHQDENALFMQEIVKGVVVIKQKDLSSELLSSEIKNIIGKKLLAKMLNNIKAFNDSDNNDNKKNLSDIVYQIGKNEK